MSAVMQMMHCCGKERDKPESDAFSLLVELHSAPTLTHGHKVRVLIERTALWI